MEPNFGIFQAIVTDNSDFFTSGKIRVRVQNFYNGKFELDLTKNYDANKFNKNIMNDLEALVYTPIGGGNNYGMFALPQINSVGVVQYLNGNIHYPIWMGSFYRPEYNENDRKIKKVNIPNDNPEKEGLNSDGIVKKDTEYAEKNIKGNNGVFILRTKTTKFPNNDSANMDFNQQRTENLIDLSDKELRLIHFSKWKNGDNANNARMEQWEEITFSNENDIPKIDILITDIKNINTGNEKIKTIGLKIDLNEISLIVDSIEEKIRSSISSNSKGIKVSSTNKENTDINTSFSLTPQKVTLTNQEAVILLQNNEISISVPDGKINLSGNDISIGDGGGFIMVRDTEMLPTRTEDGAVIKTSKVKA